MYRVPCVGCLKPRCSLLVTSISQSLVLVGESLQNDVHRAPVSSKVKMKSSPISFEPQPRLVSMLQRSYLSLRPFHTSWSYSVPASDGSLAYKCLNKMDGESRCPRYRDWLLVPLLSGNTERRGVSGVYTRWLDSMSKNIEERLVVK